MINVNDSVNPRVIRLNSYRHLCELGFLLCLTLILCGWWLLEGWQRWGWIAVWSSGLVLSFVLARYFSREAIFEYVGAQFTIGRQRMVTLQAIEAPRDLIDCFRKLESEKFTGERDFFTRVESEIGSASRCADLKELIFKYTYTGTRRPSGDPISVSSDENLDEGHS